MTSEEKAKEIIQQAHDFLNGNPQNRVQEFLLAKEVVKEPDDENESPQERLEIVEVPLHEDTIHTKLNTLFVEEMSKILLDVVENEDKPISRYDAGNINQDITPLQYIQFSKIPDYDLFNSLIDTNTFPEESYDALGSADFQVLRVRDKWGKMFCAFRKFTRRQIVGSSWKVKLALTGGDEYDIFEENLFALPEKFDAFYFDGQLFVVNQGSFEDIFNYFAEYEDRTNEVIDELAESEITIHNSEFFKNCVSNDRSALRKMAVVKKRGLYKNLTPKKVKQEIDQYGLNVNTVEKDGEWGLVLPNKGDKKDLIRILNDGNLYSESTERRYQVTGGKQEVN
jgi:hypothetical protein